MLIRPAMTSSEPAAGSQFSLNWVGTGSPALFVMSRPGQSKMCVQGSLARKSTTAGMLVSEKITMMTRYGA